MSLTNIRGRTRPGRARAAVVGVLAGAVAITGMTGIVATPGASAKDTNPDFVLIEEDLEHILKQIQIAEAHAAGGQLLCATRTDTTGKCVPDPALPLGLRTVDGSFNNLEHPTYGSADQPFPKKLPARWRRGEAVPPGAPGNNPANTACARRARPATARSRASSTTPSRASSAT